MLVRKLKRDVKNYETTKREKQLVTKKIKKKKNRYVKCEAGKESRSKGGTQ